MEPMEAEKVGVVHPRVKETQGERLFTKVCSDSTTGNGFNMRQGGLQLKPFCDFFNHHPAWMFTDGLVKETRNRVYKIRYEIL